MSDITGAYKILISAHPEQALGAFKDILAAQEAGSKSTRSWGDTVVSLNQAWELGSKAFNVAKEAIFGLAEGFKELAVEGSEFSERRKTFENYAASVGVNSKNILNDLQEISENSLGTLKSIELLGKGLAAGFSEKEMKTVFSFMKKESELTGGSFESMAATAIEAFAKGGKSLTKFGKEFNVSGTDVTAMMKSMEERMSSFGDVGISASHVADSMANSWELFKHSVGGAIAESLGFQDVIHRVDVAVIGFMKSLDFRKISEWTDVLVQTGEKLLPFMEAFAKDVWNGALEPIWKMSKQVFSGIGIDLSTLSNSFLGTFGGGTESAKSFFKALTSGFYAVAGTAGVFVDSVINGVNALRYSVVALEGFVVTSAAKAASGALGILDSFQKTATNMYIDNPVISKLLGIDTEEMAKSSVMFSKIAHGFKTVADAAEKANEKSLDLFLLNSKDSNLAKGFADASVKAQAAIDSIKFTGVMEAAKIAAGMEEQNIIDVQRKRKEAADAEKDLATKTAKEKKEAEKAAEDERKKLVKEYEEAVKESNQRIQESEKQRFDAGLELEEKRFKRAQEDAEAEFKRSQNKISGTVTFLEDFSEKRKQIEQAQLDFFKSAKSQEMDILKNQEQAALDSYKKQQNAAKEALETELSEKEKIFRRKQEDEARAFENKQKEPSSKEDAAKKALANEIEEKKIAFKRKQEDDLQAFKKTQDAAKDALRLKQEEGSAQLETAQRKKESALKIAQEKELQALKKQQVYVEPMAVYGGDNEKTKESSLLAFKRSQEDDFAKFRREQEQKKYDFKNVQEDALKFKLKNTDTEALGKLAKIAEEKESRLLAKAGHPSSPGITLRLLASGNKALDDLAGFLLEHYSIQADAEGVTVLAG